MASLESDKVRSALTSKMKCSEQSSDHYRYILFDEDGKTILATTMVSHGGKHTIGDTLIPKMARQMKLGTSANFVGMVQCTKSREDCIAIIKATNPQKNS